MNSAPVGFRICALSLDDVAELHEIDRSCFAADISYSEREIRNLMLSAPTGPHLGAVLEDGRLAGFILTAARAGSSRGLGHVITLDVRSEYRRHGVGRALMDAAERAYRERGGQGMRLEVSVANSGAQRFYAARGYEVVRRLPGYYRRGEDGLLMEKNFVD